MVTFINILGVAFTRSDPISAKKIGKLSVSFAISGSECAKAACRMLMKLTPDYGIQNELPILFCAAFLYLQCGFVIFSQNNISTKAARKMLVKLTTGVNFINILHTHFLYERRFGSFSLVTCTYKKLLKRCSYKKFERKMLMKLTAGDAKFPKQI